MLVVVTNFLAFLFFYSLVKSIKIVCLDIDLKFSVIIFLYYLMIAALRNKSTFRQLELDEFLNSFQ